MGPLGFFFFLQQRGPLLLLSNLVDKWRFVFGG